MKRPIFALLSVVSLVRCIATILICTRNYWVYDVIPRRILSSIGLAGQNRVR